MTGRHMALLVGCNYPNTPNELHGCHTDVQYMHQTLMNRFRFDPNCIWLLIDSDNPDDGTLPTGARIRWVLNHMVGQARAGDVLFFHFSGHGMILEPPNVPRTEEAIVPCDFNLITSVDFRHIVDRVPRGATFTILSDSCHSGGLIDKEPVQIGPGHRQPNHRPGRHDRPKMIQYESMLQQLSSMTRMRDQNIGVHLSQMFGSDASLMFQPHHRALPRALHPDHGILLSGCQSNEFSLDGPQGRGGAFSYAVELIFSENRGHLSNRQIVILARHKLHSQGNYNQHPCLYCSNENADAIFLTAGYHA